MSNGTALAVGGWRRLGILAIAAVLFVAGQVGSLVGADEAAPIPPDAAVTEDKVHGLKAEYYNFGRIRPPGVAGIDSRDIAADFVANNKPVATYDLEATSIDFPPGPDGVIAPNGKKLAEFLLGEADDAEGPLAEVMSSRNIFVFTGFIEVPKEGTYEFRVPADDGAELMIGDVTVLNHFHGGWYGPGWPHYLGRAEFAEPGIYPVKVMVWDRDREAGVEVYSDVNPAGDERDVGKGIKFRLLPFLTGPDAK